MSFSKEVGFALPNPSAVEKFIEEIISNHKFNSCECCALTQEILQQKKEENENGMNELLSRVVQVALCHQNGASTEKISNERLQIIKETAQKIIFHYLSVNKNNLCDDSKKKARDFDAKAPLKG